MWHITIDQIAQSGKTQRYEYEANDKELCFAVDSAFENHSLLYSEAGQFQIIATSMEHDR